MTPATLWDAFISHASEDKQTVARPLSRLLQEKGVKVWLDEQELTLGDKLRQKIDAGLSRSRWGIVILSPHFFAKGWPQSELDGLIAREEMGEKVLLPVWHGLSAQEIVRHSPLLAARLAANTTTGLENVAEALLRAMRPETFTGRDENSEARTASTLKQRLSLMRSEPEKLEGARIGHYALQKFVGMGGTGAVYRGFSVPLGRVVAVKVFYPIEADESGVTKATERGIRGLAALHQQNIATVLDFGFVTEAEEVTPYIVYEFIVGKPLDEWSKHIQGEPGAMKRRIVVALKLVDALDAAHSCSFIGNLGFLEHGVFHGDVKPSNILIRPGDEPVLLDFMMPDLQRLSAAQNGWSMWEKDAGGKYHYERPITGVFGTPGFMPPEQEVDGIVTPESDTYALGRTFRYLFWPTMNDFEFDELDTRNVLESMGVKLEDSVDGVDPELKELVRRMIKPQPEERIRPLAAVAQTLSGILTEAE